MSAPEIYVTLTFLSVKFCQNVCFLYLTYEIHKGYVAFQEKIQYSVTENAGEENVSCLRFFFFK